MKEIWKQIADGYYAVSNLGRVRREKCGHGTWPGRILEGKLNKVTGYLYLTLSCGEYKRHCAVHKLVAETFIGPCPSGKEVNHKDLNKTHNKSSNLEYETSSGNKKHAVRNGVNYASPKLDKAQVRKIRRSYALGNCTLKDLGEKFSVHFATISQIVRGQTWKER